MARALGTRLDATLRVVYGQLLGQSAVPTRRSTALLVIAVLSLMF